jgi:hypothetical protein
LRNSVYFLVLLLVSLSGQVGAANYPCSGKKGEVARCDGELLVCNDGSISNSKRNCSAELGIERPAVPRVTTGEQCACGSGALCTGPRGGIYCVTPSGNKSYKSR